LAITFLLVKTPLTDCLLPVLHTSKPLLQRKLHSPERGPRKWSVRLSTVVSHSNAGTAPPRYAANWLGENCNPV
jgi:hypothetical protein